MGLGPTAEPKLPGAGRRGAHPEGLLQTAFAESLPQGYQMIPLAKSSCSDWAMSVLLLCLPFLYPDTYNKETL